MSDYYGSCLCGMAKFALEGKLESFFLCHCQYCKKDTGSAHASNVFSRTAKLTWLSGSEYVTTFTLENTRHRKSFCKRCGSALPSTHDTNLLVIPAGCLDTKLTKLPTAHIFTSRKAFWEKELEKLPMFEKLPK